MLMLTFLTVHSTLIDLSDLPNGAFIMPLDALNTLLKFGHFFSNSCFCIQLLDHVLTSLLLYSLEGLCKGTYTLPKQHKRRSGISFTAVSFVSVMWHCNVGSICGDTLQQSSISKHSALFVHIMCAIVTASCMRSGESVSPDIDLLISVVSASQWGEFLYSDQESNHFNHFNHFINCYQNEISLNWLCRPKPSFM